MDYKNTSIDLLGLSVRSTNCLHRARVHNVESMMKLSVEDMYQIKNMGAKSVDEIQKKIQELKAQRDTKKTTVAPGTYEYNKLLVEYLENNDVYIDELEGLSVRAYNNLRRAGIDKIAMFAFWDKKQVMSIHLMTPELADEIISSRDNYLSNISIECNMEDTEDSVDIRLFIQSPENYNLVSEYVKINDVDIQLSFQKKALRVLKKLNYTKMSEIVFKNYSFWTSIHSVGESTAIELVNYVNSYLKEHEERIIAFCKGDYGSVYTEEYVKEKILSAYEESGFVGFSVEEFVTKLNLPEDYDRNIIKRILGQYVAENKLEYVDFRCYRVYPSVFDFINEDIEFDEKDKLIFKGRIDGYTLQEICEKLGVTRERVRQKESNIVPKLKKELFRKYGIKYFDEDYYAYLYNNYSLTSEIANSWLNIDTSVYNYLVMSCKNTVVERKSLEDAVSDPLIDMGMKVRINNFIHKNFILIDEYWIKKDIASIELYVASKYCRDVMRFDDFCVIYNEILDNLEIDVDKKLYITKENIRSRENNLSGSKSIVWSQFKQMRYYDFSEYDFAELYNSLALDTYRDIEISTLKLFNSNKELMDRYDIRDHYELHNVLKKTASEYGIHNVSFNRMPILLFGTFNRADAFYEIVLNNSPISKNDLLDIIYEEYGFDRLTVAGSLLGELQPYLHNGQYSLDYKRMSNAQIEELKSLLSDDFYYFDEVKRIYSSATDGNLELINAFNLRQAGFLVFSNCILKNYKSMESYFRDLLTVPDIVDISEYKKRFAKTQAWNMTLFDVKSNYDAIELSPNELVSFNKLSKAGYTKDTFKKYCDDVYDFVDEGKIFTIASIREDGFYSELDEDGFDNWFYASIVSRDNRFSYTSNRNRIILCKGKMGISKQSIILSLVRENGSVDVYDLMNIMNSKYGYDMKSASDITTQIAGTNAYYDQYLGRLYESRERFDVALKKVEVSE